MEKTGRKIKRSRPESDDKEYQVESRLRTRSKISYKEAEIPIPEYISVMLAYAYDPERDDPTGWLMSEKLDGVRCYWNGKDMFTRNGNPFYAPTWWKEKLPKIALDGELWSGRDDF